MRKCGFRIESLSASRVVDKLAQAGITVLGAEKTHKNAVTVWVDGKDRKKVFAILSQTCYNIVEVRTRGFERLREKCVRSVGFLAGAALFLVAVCFMQTRVLTIDVVGSGSYYESQVMEILSENGTGLFSSSPVGNASVKAQILALPRVSFCSVKMSGGILTVTVEVSDENAFPETAPLLAPADGAVEELIVLRGTPLVAVGDPVVKGAPVVDNAVVSGEETRAVIVIARVKVRFSVCAEYELGKEQALAQAFLDYGTIGDAKATQTESGWRIEGYAYAESALNLE